MTTVRYRQLSVEKNLAKFTNFSVFDTTNFHTQDNSEVAIPAINIRLAVPTTLHVIGTLNSVYIYEDLAPSGPSFTSHNMVQARFCVHQSQGT